MKIDMRSKLIGSVMIQMSLEEALEAVLDPESLTGIIADMLDDHGINDPKAEALQLATIKEVGDEEVPQLTAPGRPRLEAKRTKKTKTKKTKTPAKMVACEICGKEYKARGLAIHMSRAHGDASADAELDEMFDKAEEIAAGKDEDDKIEPEGEGLADREWRE